MNSDNQKRVLVIGDSVNGEFKNCKIVQRDWSSLATIPNSISDFDFIVLSTKFFPEDYDDYTFHEFFNNKSFETSIARGAVFIAIGNPSVEHFRLGHLNSPNPNFLILDWIPIEWSINLSPGENMLRDNTALGEIRNNSFNDLALSQNGYLCSLEQYVWSGDSDIYDTRTSAEYGYNFRTLMSTRFNTGVISKVRVLKKSVRVQYGIRVFGSPQEIGSIYLFLSCRDNESPSADEVLACFFESGVTKAPDWEDDFILKNELCHRDTIDSHKAQIKRLTELIQDEQEAIDLKRQNIPLLYSAGKELERIVVKMLKQLGFDVSIPRKSNAEDCFATWTSDEFVSKFAIEVKGTSKKTVSEEGLRQVIMWKTEHSLSDLSVKGLLLVNSDPGVPPFERASPFSDQAVKVAILNDILLLTTVDLFQIGEFVTQFPEEADEVVSVMSKSSGLFDGKPLDKFCEFLQDFSFMSRPFEDNISERS